MKTLKVYKAEIYRTKQGYRFRMFSRNGKIINASEQAFSRYRTLLDSLSMLIFTGWGIADDRFPARWKRGATRCIATPKGYEFS